MGGQSLVLQAFERACEDALLWQRQQLRLLPELPEPATATRQTLLPPRRLPVAAPLPAVPVK